MESATSYFYVTELTARLQMDEGHSSMFKLGEGDSKVFVIATSPPGIEEPDAGPIPAIGDGHGSSAHGQEGSYSHLHHERNNEQSNRQLV